MPYNQNSSLPFYGCALSGFPLFTNRELTANLTYYEVPKVKPTNLPNLFTHPSDHVFLGSTNEKPPSGND